ncbi:MAG: hypothetical protein HC896_14145 [Bacteroidales bacterium]|nr:hypothetical protein [Bacteroidales bacterium]
MSEVKYNKLRKYEMYDYAESITLGPVLNDKIEGSLNFSYILAADLINRFQVKKRALCYPGNLVQQANKDTLSPVAPGAALLRPHQNFKNPSKIK